MKNKIYIESIKSLLVCFSFFLGLGSPAIVHAQEADRIKIVTVEGVGVDVQEAAQNAAQNALTNAVGSFMDANKVLEKQAEIASGIRSQTSRIRTDIKEYSQGTIKSFELLDAKKQGGLTRVTARISVRMDEFSAYVKKLAEGHAEVGSGLFAQIATEGKQLNNQAGLVADNIFLPVVRGLALDIEVGKPYPLSQIESKFTRTSFDRIKRRYGSAGIVVFDVQLSLKDEFYKNMLKTASSVSTESTSVHNSEGVGKVCKERLGVDFSSDLCFFIKDDDSPAARVVAYSAKGARIEISKKMPWISRPLNTDIEAPLPRLEIALLGENGEILQQEIIDHHDIRSSPGVVIFTKEEPDQTRSSRPSFRESRSEMQFRVLTSLFGAEYGTSIPGILKKRAFSVAVGVTPEALKNAKRISVKFVK